MAKDSKFRIIIGDKVDLRGMKALQARLGKVRTSIRRAFSSAPMRAFRLGIAAAGTALVVATKQAVGFNIAMARAWTMSSKGKGWFKDMREEVRSLSMELGIAKDQIAKGLYQALSAGVPENNVVDFLRTASKIAVADGSDVAVAVDGLTTVLNAFKIEAEKTDEVADQLFNTVANGKTTFGELAQHLAVVAPIAAANGIALNEVLAAVATLTKQGTPTAQAMTQIRAAIIGANKALGDGWTNTMSLQDGLGAIEQQADGSQKKLMKLVGSIEAVQGVLGLTGKNASMAADDLASTEDAAGKVEAAFEKVDQFNHWEQLWQSVAGLVERVAQEADERLAPAVVDMVDALGKLQGDDDAWSGLGDTLDEAMATVTGIYEYIRKEGADGLQDVIGALGQILLGHAQNGAEAAVQVLAKHLPLLGDKLGAAVRDGVLGRSSAKSNAKDRANERLDSAAKEQTDIYLGYEYSEDLPWFGKQGKKTWKDTFRDKRKQLKDIEYSRLVAKYAQEEYGKEGLQFAGQIGSGAGDVNVAAGQSRLNNFTAPAAGAAGSAEVNGVPVRLPAAGSMQVNGQPYAAPKPGILSASSRSEDGAGKAEDALSSLKEKTGQQVERITVSAEVVGETTKLMVESTATHMEKISEATLKVQDRTDEADKNMDQLTEMMGQSIDVQNVMRAAIAANQRQLDRLEQMVAALRSA